MGRDALGIVSGLAVLTTGVIAVVSMVGPADRPPVEDLPPPITTVTVPEAVAAVMPTEGLPGVGPAITRVLQWSGNAGLADDADLTQLPPSVASLLIEYGVPLRVPTSSVETQ